MVHLFENRYEEPWEHYEFTDILPDDLIRYLRLVSPHCFYEEHTEGDELTGNYDEKNLKYFHPHNPHLARLFTTRSTVRSISRAYNITPKYVRFTIMDITGSREVFYHCDDPEKLATIQVYITDKDSAELGTWYYKNHGDTSPVKRIRYKNNCGHTFKPIQGVTWHSIPAVAPDDLPRRSLVINYTNTPTEWKINQSIFS
jgi:hypothetical protein